MQNNMLFFFPQHFQLEDVFEQKILVYNHLNHFHIKTKATDSQVHKKKKRVIFFSAKHFPKHFF